jgi:hypothetical protein
MSGMSSMLRIALDWDIPSPNEPNEKGGNCRSGRCRPERILHGIVEGIGQSGTSTPGRVAPEFRDEPKEQGERPLGTPLSRKPFPFHSARCARSRGWLGGMPSMVLMPLMRSTPGFWMAARRHGAGHHNSLVRDDCDPSLRSG